MQSTRLRTSEGLLNYITEVMRAKVALEEKLGLPEQRVAGEIQALATSVHKEVLSEFVRNTFWCRK